MESKINHWICPILAVSALLFISCNSDKSYTADDSTPPQETQSKGIPEEKTSVAPAKGAIIFIDKSASLQKISPEEVSEAGEQMFNRLKTFFGDSGGEVTIYFIHKDLAGASPFLKVNCYMKDTKGLTAFPAAAAKNKYKREVDSLKNQIIEAIKIPLNQSTSLETDLWITLKKAEDGFVNLPQNGQRLLMYYSDMVESVSKSTCGKDYEHKKFKDVPEAEAMGKKDVEPIKDCYNIVKFSGPSEVFICFPIGALQTSKHPFMFDYWRALFAEFGVSSVRSNL